MSGSGIPGAFGKKNFWTWTPLSIRILLAAGLGILAGILLRQNHMPFLKSLNDVSKLFIDLLKALATPLIFFAVVDAIVRTNIPMRKGVKLVCISTINACVAIVIGLGAANLLHGGDNWKGQLDVVAEQVASAASGPLQKVDEKPQVKLEFVDQITKYVPKNFVDPFQTNNIITVVLIAILAGAALRRLKNRATIESASGVRTVEDAVQAISHVFMVVLGWIIEIIPLAIFGVVAKVVGETGIALFKNLGVFVAIIVLGFFLQTLVYYSFLLIVIARTSPLKFYKGAYDAIITAMSCGSSLATLPVTLRCLKDNLKISDANARLSACVGTNLNHAGIILYEAAATIFVAQAIGLDLSLGQQMIVALASVAAGVGIAGVPEAGLITLQLVLTAGGIPSGVIVKVLPLLFTVDWIIGRGRATVNVISDMTVATLLERIDPDVETITLAHGATPVSALNPVSENHA